MPRGEGSGPSWGSGPGIGRGAGMGGAWRERIGGERAGAGPERECICPQCGTVVSHAAGVPCPIKPVQNVEQKW
jgi:hypothetical protein